MTPESALDLEPALHRTHATAQQATSVPTAVSRFALASLLTQPTLSLALDTETGQLQTIASVPLDTQEIIAQSVSLARKQPNFFTRHLLLKH